MNSFLPDTYWHTHASTLNAVTPANDQNASDKLIYSKFGHIPFPNASLDKVYVSPNVFKTINEHLGISQKKNSVQLDDSFVTTLFKSEEFLDSLFKKFVKLEVNQNNLTLDIQTNSINDQPTLFDDL